MTTVIVITAKRNGFRRCGVAHSDQPTTWHQDDFTDEQWEELSKEPQLFLAVEDRDLGQGLEPRHAFTSSTALPEAQSTAQNPQPKAVEAGTTTLGDGVLLPIAPVADNIDLLWTDALLEDQACEVEKALASADVELASLWDEAIKEDQDREAAKALAAKPPAKPGKAKVGKA